MTGWFAVKRGITRHPIFKKQPLRIAVWMWLLDNACWKDTEHDVRGKTITVHRGQVAGSIRSIADQSGVGVQVVRTLFSRLQTEHMINTETTQGKTIITLCNYDKYQLPKTDANTPTNKPPTQGQHTKEQGNKSSLREDDISGSQISLDDVRNLIAEGREKKAPVKKSKPKKQKTAIPDLWLGNPELMLMPNMLEISERVGMTLETAKNEASKFVNYHHLGKTRSAVWGQNWSTWCGNWNGRQYSNRSQIDRTQASRDSGQSSGLLGAAVRKHGFNAGDSERAGSFNSGSGRSDTELRGGGGGGAVILDAPFGGYDRRVIG